MSEFPVLDLSYELTRYPAVPKKSSPGEHYGHALSFFDTMIEEASTRGVPVHDRLDAQGVMWVIAGGGERGPYDLSPDEWGELDAFVGGSIHDPQGATQEGEDDDAQANNRPTIRICPLCVNDDEVRLFGPTGIDGCSSAMESRASRSVQFSVLLTPYAACSATATSRRRPIGPVLRNRGRLDSDVVVVTSDTGS